MALAIDAAGVVSPGSAYVITSDRVILALKIFHVLNFCMFYFQHLMKQQNILQCIN